MKRRSLAIASAIPGLVDILSETPTPEDLQAFEDKCREVSLAELGHLLFTAPTKAHTDVAVRIVNERLK